MKTPPHPVRLRFALAFAVLASALGLRAGPWEPLFNGKDLSGWKVVNGTAPYFVENGAIVGATKAGSPNSFLATERVYGDFILELDLKQEGGASNSGVQFRGLSTPAYMNGRVHGYQCEIDPGERAWSGGIYDEARRGWLYPVTLNPPARAAYRQGEWNHVRIEAIGDTLRTWINGQPVAHVIDSLTREGFIALQIHSIGDASAAGRRVLFRDLRIQTTDLTPSPPAPIFVRNTTPNTVSPAERADGWRLLWDGVSAKGWRSPVAGLPGSAWTIENGELVARQGRTADDRAGAPSSALSTEATFTAFELQFEVNLPAGARGAVDYWAALAAPAATTPAYALVDPGLKAGDERQGLASLRGLVARGKMPAGAAIVPKTGEWQHGRIIAHADGRVEHWLNGIQVVTYDRTSPAWKSLELAARPEGAITLVSDAPGLRFRSLKIRELK